MLRILFLSLSLLLIICKVNAQITITSIVVEENNVSGGGFQSDVTITEDGGTVYSSADVSGIFKSTDGGLSYEQINEGLKSPKTASLAITPDNDQILYAGTGDKGGSGGLFRSIDGGDTWELTAAGASAQFAGNHSATGDPVPDAHPRSNGDLIVVVEGTNASTFTDDIVIAGTYKDGVRIFAQGGEVEVSAVNTSGFVRSVAYNSAVPNTVYAAIQFSNSTQNGIYKIDFTNPSAPTSSLEYQTPLPEGLTVLASGRVYAAIGDGGIVKYNGTSWSLKNTGLAINEPLRQWTAVTGYLKGSNDVVYASLNNLGGSGNNTNYSSIWRTVNNGQSWTPLVDADSNVLDTIYGKSYEWWYRKKAFQQAGLGRTNSVVSSIEVARGPFPNVVSDDIIYVSGRGGIWKSEDGGDFWKPAVYNMQATSNNNVAVNPNNPTQVVLANTDYVVLETSNRFENSDISRDKPGGAESRAYDAIFDATSNELIVGTGDRDTNSPGGGEVFIKSASALGNPSDAGWTDTNLDAATASNNGRVRAVTYGYHNGTSATSQTILAAVEGQGVFRYHNGTWSQSSGISIGATERSNFVWPDNGNSGVVYLLDLLAGLYRSNDGGQSWTNIWTSMSFNNNDFYNTGYITADDNDPATLYLSIQGRSGSPIGTGFRVYKMTGADTGVFGAPGTAGITDITFHSGASLIKRPGPIVFGPDGRLWLTQQQNSPNSIDAALFVMENPATDLSFTDVTTNQYRNIATRPSGIDVSSDGHVYISQSGAGLVKLQYVETPNTKPDISVRLEAAYEPSLDKMSNTLETLNLIPDTQPFNQAPWDYDGTETNSVSQVSDWVLVSFRTDIDANTEIARVAGLLQTDGKINFPSSEVLPDNFNTPVYIVIESRNHLIVMSPQPVTMSNGTLTYDFSMTDSYSNAIGAGQKQLPNGKWVMYAGDVNNDLEINGADKAIWNGANGVFNSYTNVDISLNGDVNGGDKSIWVNNNGIFSVVPND